MDGFNLAITIIVLYPTLDVVLCLVQLVNFVCGQTGLHKVTSSSRW